LLASLFSYLPMPKIAQWSYSKTFLFTVAGAVSGLLQTPNQAQLTDFPFHSYVAQN
jgi:hypothetical protein